MARYSPSLLEAVIAASLPFDNTRQWARLRGTVKFGEGDQVFVLPVGTLVRVDPYFPWSKDVLVQVGELALTVDLSVLEFCPRPPTAWEHLTSETVL